MSNKFGLYVKSDNEYLNREGYPEASPTPSENVWVRTGLYYSGKPITKTSIEQNNLGVYVNNNEEILLNGSNVADLASANGFGVTADSKEAIAGSTVLSRPSGVIDITLDNYNQLRSGHRVEGYARYNDLAVYRIVDHVENTNNNIEFEPPEGIYDIVYNSYTEDLEETPLSINTILDTNTPELAMRHVDQYGEEGKGITIEYFVDTKYYDSINKGIIGDRFTVIVEDSFGRNLYKHTTYAGHFRITTSAFLNEEGTANLTGETWFSIRCVDSHGRGSCEWFFSVFIRSNSYRERLYNVTSDDLNYYGITPNRNNTIDAYRNRLGFTRLIVDVKNGVKGSQYNGIKFFNPNPNVNNIKNNQNYAYYINLYPDIAHVDADRNLTNNTYKTRADKDFKFPTQDYYIFKYHAGSKSDPAKLDTIQVKNAGSSTYTTASFEVVNGVDSAIDWSKLSHENIEAFKIEPGKSFIIDGRTVTIPNNVDIVDWIWNDGAYICRDGDKIIRHQDGPSDYDPQHAAYVKDWRNSHCVRCITINANRKAAIRRYKASYSMQVSTVKDGTVENYPFKPGEGYYYASFYNGTEPNGISDRYGVSDLPVLDDFIIDFNYTSWKLLDVYLIQGRSNLLELGLAKNVEVRNAWIKGAYDGSESQNQEAYILNLIKRGYITQNIITLVPWEGCGLVNIVGGRFCTFNNVHLSGSLGYDYMAHAPGSHAYIHPINHYFKDIPRCQAGYINPITKQLVTNSTAILKNEGNSLLKETSVDYVAGSSTDICLGTTSDYMSLDAVDMTGVKNHIPSTMQVARTREYSDEFVIGGFNHRPNGKCTELFVHFYDDNNVCKKVVKTQINRRIKKIRGTTKIKLSLYATGTLVKGSPVLYLADNILKRLKEFRPEGCGVTESIMYNNCNFGISKTCTLEPTAINLTVKDSVFSNASYTPKLLATENPYPIGIEEHGCLQMLTNFINTRIENIAFGASDGDTESEETVSNMRVNPHNQINCSRNGTYLNMINCVGFVIYGGFSKVYIDKSYVYALSTSFSPRHMPNGQVVTKHSIVKNGGTWGTRNNYSDTELAYLREPIYDSNTQNICSSCEEDINTIMSFEECFFNKPIVTRNGRKIKGRLYHSGELPFDIYYSMTLDKLISLWNTRFDYSSQERNDGWIHILVYCLTPNIQLRVGNKIKNQCYKENGNVVVVVDGVKHYNLFNDITTNQGKYAITVPAKGYHLISFRLISTLSSSAYERYLNVPVGALLVDYPKAISENLSLFEALSMPDTDVTQEHEHDNDRSIEPNDSGIAPKIIMHSEIPVKYRDPRGGINYSDIYVPSSAVNQYYNYSYWKPNKDNVLEIYYPYKGTTRLHTIDELNFDEFV